MVWRRAALVTAGAESPFCLIYSDSLMIRLPSQITQPLVQRLYESQRQMPSIVFVVFFSR